LPFLPVKFITYVDTVIGAIKTLQVWLGALRTSWLGVARGSAALLLNLLLLLVLTSPQARALAVTGVALMGVYAYAQGNKEPERVDPRQGKGYTDSLLAQGKAMGLPDIKKPKKKPKKPVDQYESVC
jgi:hypothetical protein